MAKYSGHSSLYTDDRGRASAKWIAINALLVIFSLFCLVAVFYLASHPLQEEPEPAIQAEAPPPFELVAPDFATLSTVEERKAAFFQFLTPIVQEENRSILSKRQRILNLREELRSAGSLSSPSRAALASFVKEYRFEDEKLSLQQQIDKLLLRVDKIPLSMALAQAATESAWGTSRFATEGNNFFGQWCFRPGCGQVPLERAPGLRHEVASFDDARASVRSYLRNLNTHNAYRHLRELRAGIREAGTHLVGLELIKALGSYSERGQDYVRELRLIIAGNGLEELDLPQEKDESLVSNP